jgi:cyclohexanecarboxylate-CoA ligase
MTPVSWNSASTIQDPILPEARVKAMIHEGWWPGRVITECLDEAAGQLPDKVAIAGHDSTTGQRTTLSYRQLRTLANRIALGLVALGVERSQVVSAQLPNWWQFVAIKLACTRIGAVFNPVMPIFRHHELTFMFRLAQSKVVIVPRVFRGFDHRQMIMDIRRDLPDLKHVLVIGGEGEESFEDILTDRRREDEMDAEAVFAERTLKPDEVMQLLYTSGTTGEPKGAMHTPNTQFSNIVEFAARMRLSDQDVIFMPSPLAHQVGYIYGVMLPIYLGAKLVLQDVWSPELALQRIQDEGATFTMAATPFLADLADAPMLPRYDVSTLRIFACAGAPIPGALVARAQQRLGARIVAAWGMTEVCLVTQTLLDDPEEKVFGTDGIALPGMELRIVEPETRRERPRGEGGLLLCRGAGTFVGYLKRPEMYDIDADGWFSTGDLARMDADGYIRITGRVKDIIIRGGENIPVVEIESVLYRHPAVKQVAIVGMPDERLGERACAFVVLHAEARLDLSAMTAFLEDNRVARPYWPERLEIVDALPQTASGKIQKFKLREIAKNLRVAAA